MKRAKKTGVCMGAPAAEYVLASPSFYGLAGFGCSCLSDMSCPCLSGTGACHSRSAHVCHSRTSKVVQSVEKLDICKSIFCRRSPHTDACLFLTILLFEVSGFIMENKSENVKESFFMTVIIRTGEL